MTEQSHALQLTIPEIPRLEGRVCMMCRTWKAWSEFNLHSRAPLGRTRKCRACANAEAKIYRTTITADDLGRRSRVFAEKHGLTKVCSVCKSVRPISEFPRNSSTRSGSASACKTCCYAMRVANYKVYMIRAARARATTERIQFSLTIENTPDIPEFCPITSIPLIVSKGAATDTSPSLDRLNPVLGYVPRNVHVISWLANRLKNNCSDPAVFEAIAHYLRENARLREAA